MSNWEKFIIECQRRLNHHLLLREGVLAANFAVLTALILSLAFIVRGLRVDLRFLALAPLFGVALLSLRYFHLRYNVPRAAAYADRFFSLGDALISSLEFSKSSKNIGFFGLQLRKTEILCDNSDLTRIRNPFPRKSLSSLLLFFLLTLWLCSWDEAPALKKKRSDEKSMLELTEQINKKLREQAEEQEKKMTDEEKELLRKSGLKRELAELKKMKDKMEALKKYAKLEGKIKKLSEKFKMAEDQKLLEQIAKALKKAAESKKIGEDLARGQYRKASEKLKKMRVSPKSKQKMAEKRMEKLRKLAERMKDRAEQMKNNKSNFRKSINKLMQACENYQKAMKSSKQSDQGKAGDSGKFSQKMKNAKAEANKSLSEFSDKLNKLGTKKSFIQKMMAMKKSLGSGRESLLSTGMSELAQNKNGKGIGTEAQKDLQNIINDNKEIIGQLTRLTGTKGAGEAATSVEDAAFGTGVSKFTGKSKKANFKYQVESYISREDVPENMKQGVKNYFEIIHQ